MLDEKHVLVCELRDGTGHAAVLLRESECKCRILYVINRLGAMIWNKDGPMRLNNRKK